MTPALIIRDTTPPEPSGPPRDADGRPLRYLVGLDLGQTQDFTALAVLERRRVRPDDLPHNRQPPYSVRHLQRFYLGTPYPEVVSAVIELLRKPPLPGCLLLVDQTGVGRAVVDLFRQGLAGKVTCRMKGITITAGASVTQAEDGELRVPKKDLVGVLQSLLQTRRLLVASSLPDAVVLVKELENFKVKFTAAANETYEAWREGDHDDLVLAVALAAWAGEQGLAEGEGSPPPRPSRLRPT